MEGQARQLIATEIVEVHVATVGTREGRGSSWNGERKGQLSLLGGGEDTMSLWHSHLRAHVLDEDVLVQEEERSTLDHKFSSETSDLVLFGGCESLFSEDVGERT